MLQKSDIRKMMDHRDKLEVIHQELQSRWYSLDDELCDVALQMEDIQGEINRIDAAIGKWEEESEETADPVTILDGQTCMFSDMTLTPTQGE